MCKYVCTIFVSVYIAYCVSVYMAVFLYTVHRIQNTIAFPETEEGVDHFTKIEYLTLHVNRVH